MTNSTKNSSLATSTHNTSTTNLKKDRAKDAAERRRLQKQEEEQAKLDAIEAKIEKARLRIEETKN